MRFFTGQPAAWQKGMPQSMQRAACSLSTLSTSGRSISYQSLIRSRNRTVGDFRRAVNCLKPVGLPMYRNTSSVVAACLALDLLALAEAVQGLAVVDRHDLDEAARHLPPAIEDHLGLQAAGPAEMAADEVLQQSRSSSRCTGSRSTMSRLQSVSNNWCSSST